MSEQPSLRSDKDTTDYIKYLLEGSGAEENLNFASLRNELEQSTINSLPQSSKDTSEALKIGVDILDNLHNDKSSDISSSAKTPSGIKQIDPSALGQSKSENKGILNTPWNINLSKDPYLDTLSNKLTSMGLPSIAPIISENLSDLQTNGLVNLITAFLNYQHPSSQKDKQEIARLENKIASDQATIFKLQSQLDASQKQQEANSIRNNQILDTFRNSKSEMDPILIKIIDAYEEKLHFSSIQSNQSPSNLPIPISLENQVEWLMQENELLKMQMAEQTFKLKKSRDKQQWKFKDVEGPEKLLLHVCKLLGVAEPQELPDAIARINVAVQLIPQMKQFIHEITAIVSISNPKSSTSQTVAPLKLPEILSIIRHWAEALSTFEDLDNFAENVHVALSIARQAGSFNLCLEEIKNSSKSGRKLYADIPADSAQQAVLHFRDLFEIRHNTGVLPKMNDLYVFWAEVNDGLVRLRQVLEIDDQVQPGRVLIHAIEALEKSKK